MESPIVRRRLEDHDLPRSGVERVSDVFPLWNSRHGDRVVLDDIQRHLSNTSSKRRKDELPGVAAVFPSQEVNLDVLEF
ncbi:MAG: hypothetical protein JWQ01_1540 [Massilia sp.]|nr:hypothetical protein [Massilia sp.]